MPAAGSERREVVFPGNGLPGKRFSGKQREKERESARGRLWREERVKMVKSGAS